MGQSGSVGRGLAMGQRCFGVALTGLCRGAAAVLGFPGFPRAHALLLGALVAMGPLLRGRGDPHSVLASPHNRLEARLTSSASAWTWLLIGSLLVASHPWLRPPWGHALRALLRLAVGLFLSRAGHALGHALEVATGSCRSATPLGTLLLPLGDPAECKGAGHSWEGFGPAPQAFALVHCGLGLAEEAAALGRRLYGRGGKMAAAGKMAAGYEVGEESKMAGRYGVGEEAKMAGRFKMAAGYGVGEEGKMAARYGLGEESKMAGRVKMAAGYGMGEEGKMAPRYGPGEEAKMAVRSKMAPGYGAGEESKMAAGWAWPRPIWRPLGFEWAEPPHANYGWGGAGGHLGRPYMGGHFEGRSGGHFDGRRSPYEGGHFERYGGHFDERSGGHFDGRSGGHFEERSGSHFDHHSGHFDGYGGRFESPHFHPDSHHFGGHLEHPAGHFARPGGHLESTYRHFEGSQRHVGGGHLGEAPPLALSVLYLLALALLVTWHLLLVVTLTYRNTWARNAAGAALGWAAWAVTYRGWYRRPWSPGPPGWG